MSVLTHVLAEKAYTSLIPLVCDMEGHLCGPGDWAGRSLPSWNGHTVGYYVT